MFIRRILPYLFPLFITISSCSQDPASPRLVGGPCEGCEAVLEFGDNQLKAVDTLPDFHDEGTQFRLQGTIYQPDGKTPAPGTILYIYHTNQEGIYATRGGEKGWDRRHGYIRGWIRTGKDGKYAFYTLVPGAYPGGTNPAHIHPVILEPDGKYYWLSEIVFRRDPILKKANIDHTNPRGGHPGILELKKTADLLTGTYDIVLGANVPGYK